MALTQIRTYMTCWPWEVRKLKGRDLMSEPTRDECLALAANGMKYSDTLEIAHCKYFDAGTV